jgi:hypothetical protein
VDESSRVLGVKYPSIGFFRQWLDCFAVSDLVAVGPRTNM